MSKILKKGKIKSSEILYNIFYLILFFYVLAMITNGKPDDNSISLVCGIFGLLCIVGAIMNFGDPAISNRDSIIALVIELVLASIAFSKKGYIGYILIAILFVWFALGRVFYTIGSIKVSFEQDVKLLAIYRLGRLLGLISILLAALYLAFLSLEGWEVGTFSFIPQIQNICEILSILGIVLVLVGTIIVLIYYTPVKSLNSKSNNSYHKLNSTNNESNSTNNDTRKKAYFGFSSILYDRCYDIARHYSCTKDFGYGSVKIDIVVKINGDKINYIFNGNIGSVKVDNYNINQFKDSLNDKLQSIANLLVYDTENAIEKLRDEFKDFDGEYSINVTQGEFKA